MGSMAGPSEMDRVQETYILKSWVECKPAPDQMLPFTRYPRLSACAPRLPVLCSSVFPSALLRRRRNQQLAPRQQNFGFLVQQRHLHCGTKGLAPGLLSDIHYPSLSCRRRSRDVSLLLINACTRLYCLKPAFRPRSLPSDLDARLIGRGPPSYLRASALLLRNFFRLQSFHCDIESCSDAGPTDPALLFRGFGLVACLVTRQLVLCRLHFPHASVFPPSLS